MSKKFVVLECKGKQYIVSEGDIVSVDLIHEDVKKKLTFDNVLLLSDKGNVKLGQPYLDLSVSAEIIAHERDKKVHVFKFKKKTGYKKKQGHKQSYTTIKILSIGAKKASKKESEEKVASKTTKKETSAKADS